MPSSGSERFEGLHYFRGIAAVAVVLFHTGGYAMLVSGNDVRPAFFEVLTTGMGWAVYLFFAISGFLVASMIRGGYDNFLPRRLLRIYPSYFIAVFLVVVVKSAWDGQWVAPSYYDGIALLPVAQPGAGYPLRVEWTLIYEVFYYLVCSIFTIPTVRRAFPWFLCGWLS